MSAEELPADGFWLPAKTRTENEAAPYRHPPQPTRNAFLAWHRPRKQYVREKQWSNAVLEVMTGRDQEDKIKYIGLPGIDLLDLRQMLRTVCEPQGRQLHYIGFDSVAGSLSPEATELNISESELRAQALVHEQSNVRPDDLRYLGKRSTSAWRAARAFGHVDVINFDLTTTMFDDSAENPISYMGALKEILALQAGNPRPWVLLLTTRVDRQDMKPGAIEPLLQQVADIAATCADLDSEVLQAGLTLQDPTDIDQWDDASLRVAGLAGTIHWLRKLLNDGAVATRVKLTSCFVYTSFSSGGTVDVASLVVRFDGQPTNLVDTVYVSDSEDRAVAEVTDSYCASVVRDYVRIAKSPNIDDVIRETEVLRREMTTLSADLLEAARYSRSEYLSWADGQPS